MCDTFAYAFDLFSLQTAHSKHLNFVEVCRLFSVRTNLTFSSQQANDATQNFVHKTRAKYAETPICLVENTNQFGAKCNAQIRAAHAERNNEQLARAHTAVVICARATVSRNALRAGQNSNFFRPSRSCLLCRGA